MTEPTGDGTQGRQKREPGQQAAEVLPLPLPHPAGSQAAAPVPQSMRWHEFADTLTRISDGIFRAGLTLQAALDRPPDGLRQAAEHTLDLLDETVREARDAAFAGRCNDADGQEAILTRSGLSRAQSLEVRARTLQIAALSAATEEQLAATLGQMATTCPDRSARLRALSQSAARRAAWLRQWADGHAATG